MLPPRRLLRTLAGALLALALVPAAASAAEPGVTPLNMKGGDAVDEPSNIARVLNHGGWVRMFANWNQVVQSPSTALPEMNARVNAFRGGGQKVIIAVQAPPPGIDM